MSAARRLGTAALCLVVSLCSTPTRDAAADDLVAASLVYASVSSIWAIDSPGAAPRLLLENVESRSDLVASADGRDISIADGSAALVAPTDGTAATFVPGGSASAALSPDGTVLYEVVTVPDGSYTGLTQLRALTLATRSSRVVATLSEGAFGAVVSADGKRLAYVGGGSLDSGDSASTAEVVDLATGDEVQVRVPGDRAVRLVAFGPDDGVYVTTCEDADCEHTAVRDAAGVRVGTGFTSSAIAGSSPRGLWLVAERSARTSLLLLPTHDGALQDTGITVPREMEGRPLVLDQPPAALSTRPLPVTAEVLSLWRAADGTVPVRVRVELDRPGAAQVCLSRAAGDGWTPVGCAPVRDGTAAFDLTIEQSTRVLVTNSDGAPLVISTVEVNSLLSMRAARRGAHVVLRGSVRGAQAGTVQVQRMVRGKWVFVRSLPIRAGHFAGTVQAPRGATVWQVVGGADRLHVAGASPAVRVAAR